MPHYAYVLSLSRLELEMSLGFLPKELIKKQRVEISFRMYFSQEIPSNRDDQAAFRNR